MTAAAPWFYKPARKEDRPRRVTPSVYTQEMLQSTEERLANTKEVHSPRILELLDMSETTHHKLTMVDLDQPLFQPYPSELVFQNFTLGQTYELQLRLLNMDKAPRRVKLEMEHSDVFCAITAEQSTGKVASSCCANFTVFFSPKEDKDYHHTVVFVTDRERFEVPVRAIGPRAILNFRDELRFPVCPVKASTERTQQVINIGNSTAKFELRTQRPFSVSPSYGTLEPGENMQVIVTFNPTTAGDHSQDLLVHYHTGEDVYVNLFGICEELDVRLEFSSITLQNTYVSLASVHKVSLTNGSDHVLKYHWSVWPGQEEEDVHLLRESSVLQKMEEEESEQALLKYRSDPTVIHRLPLLTKALQNGRSQAAQERLALLDSCIILEPATGEIWPKMTQQFTVVFKPKEAELYRQTIYCDVTGRQSRLALTVRGEGLGPQLQLNYNLVDMKNVFMGDRDCCEVLVSNKGMIDAPFTLSRPNTTFGRCFSFSPDEGVVPFGASLTVRVTFQSHILGTFSEDLLLTVKGQPEPLVVTFRGSVVGPTFHFDVLELNFGDVAFGFPQTLTCTLFNTSFVPMNFHLRVLGDGQASPSVTSGQQVSDESRKKWQSSAARDPCARPVEFSISPAADTVRSMSDVAIKVTLCSNTVRTYRLAMVVDVEGVGEEIRTLPINARCVVPEVLVETPLLEFQRCFLGHPYEQHVLLSNPSSLPACYGVLEQEYEEFPLLLFYSSTPRGVIPPHSSEKVPITLLAKAIGRLRHTVCIAVFGSAQPPVEVVLSCVGQGPVIHIQNPQLDFGKIPVLTDVSKTLQLLNQSPVPANFTTCMSGRRSCWRVEPCRGEVPAGGWLDLRVVAHMKDTMNLQEKLEVSIQDSHTHTVTLSATGTGTSIVSDRTFAPSLDLGTHFSHGPCQYHFTLTNRGQRTHWMNWGVNGFHANTKVHTSQSFLPPISLAKKKDVQRHSSLVAPREEPVFNLSPSRVKLLPGYSVDMVLTGFSDTAQVVKELLVCRGTIGEQGCNQQIMSVEVTCQFVAPLLNLSSKQLNFCMIKVPGERLKPTFEKLVLKNISSLPLTMRLSLLEPFSLCSAPGTQSSVTTKSIVLCDGKAADLWICFNPEEYRDRMSRVVNEFLKVSYEGHPQQDIVELHADVHFPNLSFSTSTVEFGCILNYTESHRVVKMTNCSKLPVSYHWTFLQNHKYISSRDTDMDAEEQKSSENDSEDGASLSGMASPAAPLPGPVLQTAPIGSVTIHSEPVVPHDVTSPAVRVEEVFDVLPMHGYLQPGENQLVTVTFCGHGSISSEVVARCHVEEGPTYDIQLSGEASGSSYSLDPNHIDYGLLLFNHLGEAEVTLRNTGKVGFHFEVLQPQTEEVEDKEEDEEGEEEDTTSMEDEKEVVVEEKMIEEKDADEEEPGEQEKTSETSEEQTQDTKQSEDDSQTEDPQDIMPGQPVVIPRVGYVDAGTALRLRVLYLPGLPEVFVKMITLQVAFLPPQDITVTGEGVFPRISLNVPRDLEDERYNDVVEQARGALECEPAEESSMVSESEEESDSTFTLTEEEQLNMEIERLLVRENALALTGSLMKISDGEASCRKWYKLSKFLLPDYILDFGYVILGRVHTHSVAITNVGSVPLSFQGNFRSLPGTGFTAEFERVKNLPCHESVMFNVIFDPRGAQLPLGDVSVTIPIQVVGGPSVQLRLRAVVTMPSVSVSTEALQFDPVQCGMCQVRMIQLMNPEPVPCYWNISEDLKPVIKVNKFLPSYLRRKVLMEHPRPIPAFQMLPCSGKLSPGARANVLIKFIPIVADSYSRKLVVSVEESSDRIIIVADGESEEPRLEFCPPLLEMRTCLPSSLDIEAEVIVKNPCSFPIEFFYPVFDAVHLEEEKILRKLPGYDEDNILLLPPRKPGRSLPKEILHYYDTYCSHLEDEEITPEVNCGTAVLDSHNHRGIAMIVYEGPMTEESRAPFALAEHYGGVCLTVDEVISNALRNGTSPVSLAARKCLDKAAADHYEKEAAQMDDAPPSPPDSPGTPSSTSDDATGSSVQSNESEKSFLELCLRGQAMSLINLLPEPLMIDILLERFQVADCHRAIVVNGVKSAYTETVANTLQLILMAFQNRKHIYMVNLIDSCFADMMKEKKRRNREPKGPELKGECSMRRGRPNMSDPFVGVGTERQVGNREGVTSLYSDFGGKGKHHKRKKDPPSNASDSIFDLSAVVTGRLHRRRRNDPQASNLSDPIDAPLETEKEKQRKRKQTGSDSKRKEDVKNLTDLTSTDMGNAVASILSDCAADILEEKATEEEEEDRLSLPDLTGAADEGLPRLILSAVDDEIGRPKRGRSLSDTFEPDMMDGVILSDTLTALEKEWDVTEGVSTVLKPLDDTALLKPIDEIAFLKPIDVTDLGASRMSGAGKHHMLPMRTEPSPPLMDKLVKEKALVIDMQAQLGSFGESKAQIAHILKYWDRSQCTLLVPFPVEEVEVQPEKKVPEKKGKKGQTKAAPPTPTQAQAAAVAEAEKELEAIAPDNPIPHIALTVTEKIDINVEDLLRDSVLPSLDEVWSDLGLGPDNAPAVTLSIVPFPKDRQEINIQPTRDWFTILDPLWHVKHAEEKKDSDDEKGKDKDKRGRERAKRHQSKMRGRRGMKNGTTEQEQHQELLEQKRSQSLTACRWVVPASGEVNLKLWFYADSLGSFEQTYNFEIMGIRKLYQLHCRGNCSYPSISKDHITVFSLTKMLHKPEERMAKTYIMNQKCFEFGPLLCSKTRESYKNNSYVENSQRFVIHNNSGLETEVQFHFQHDTQGSTYLLDPAIMTLEPNEKKEMTVWAYPTREGQVKDTVLCCVKDNPDTLTFDISCWGVWPRMELEGKHLNYDRILLHRDEIRTMILTNKCALPISWRLQDLEFLGDEFTVPQDHGIIEAFSSFNMNITFGAKRPLLVKKMLRIEVSDVDKILGVVQTENIKLSAEAYDIDLIFPTSDKHLNFGVIRVFDESKLSLKIKNHGKYDVGFNFVFKQTRTNQPKLEEMFSVIPQNGLLKPQDKPTSLQVVCKPRTDVSIREQNILICEVIEPNMEEGGAVATIEFKVTVKAVFARFKITPPRELNFGPLTFHGNKKSLTFTIENNGIFETHFTIIQTGDPIVTAKPGGACKKEKPVVPSSKARRDSSQKESIVPQSRLAVGIFQVTPASGLLLPSSQQVVTVDCAPEQLGCLNQTLLIEVIDRDPTIHPKGIPFRLLAEVSKPGIVLDLPSIFEEHYMCHTSRELSSEQFLDTNCTFVTNENKLAFHGVLVGQTVKARLKFTNSRNVPCVLSLLIKCTGRSVFDLSAHTLTIPSMSDAFLCISFTPRTTQVYSGSFEATMEGFHRTTPTIKNKVLEFELTGEGDLPSVSVVRPTLRNNRGNPVLHFRRLLVGRRQSLPVVLQNDGKVQAQVQMDLVDRHGVFTIVPDPDNTFTSITKVEESPSDTEKSIHRVVLKLGVRKQAGFQVIFGSELPLTIKTKMTVDVWDSKQNKCLMKVVGETFKEVITLDNIGSSQETDQEDCEKGGYEVLNFGDCYVSCRYEESFTMTNHSPNRAVKFEWPSVGTHGLVSFSPQVGHLHAGCSKEITVAFRAKQPATLTGQSMMLKFYQLEFNDPIDQVPDWDDRRRTSDCLNTSDLTPETQSLPSSVKLTKGQPEPLYSVVEFTQREVELRIKAVSDYTKFTCPTESVVFKDTLLYQTSTHQLNMTNQGRVKVEYMWQVVMDSGSNTPINEPDLGDSFNPRGKSGLPFSRVGSVSSRAGAMDFVVFDSPEPLPFIVEPMIGAIDPDCTKTFTISFTPQEVSAFQGRLQCSVPNMLDGVLPPCISVSGQSLLPDYHIDLADSDYISGNRRNPKYKNKLDPSTRIIEFSTLGINEPVHRIFAVLNPTTVEYSYTWKCDEKVDDEDECRILFRCHNPSGTIPAGQKVEVWFEYTPEQLVVVESPWSLVIEPLSICLPFLCVGNAREPNLYLSKPYIDFGELIVGRLEQCEIFLVNGEEETFTFSFEQFSLLSENRKCSLAVEPMTGTIKPKEKLPVSIMFIPSHEGHTTFRLILKVSKKTEMIFLGINADCFALTTVVQVQNPAGRVKEVKSTRLESVNFGMVGILEESTFKFTVSNQAKFSTVVSVELTGPNKKLRYLQTTPKFQDKKIKTGGNVHFSLSFCPRGHCTLRDVQLIIKISDGPAFHFVIKGQAVAPNLEFSFTKFNFGKCFLYVPGMDVATEPLYITNKGQLDVSVQCDFEKTSVLNVHFEPCSIAAGDVMKVPVTFSPRDVRLYRKKIVFSANCFSQQVDLEGEGIELKLIVANPLEKAHKLGIVAVGQKVRRKVVVVNESLIDIPFTFELSNDCRDLTFTPTGELNLRARGGSCVVHLQFAPRRPVPPYESTLCASFSGLLHPLLTIQGCCQ